MQYLREPRRDDRLDLFLAPVVEVVAVRDDLHGARASGAGLEVFGGVVRARLPVSAYVERGDRKSPRLNSSHRQISYAGFCLKKKNIRDRDQDNVTVLTLY